MQWTESKLGQQWGQVRIKIGRWVLKLNLKPRWKADVGFSGSQN